MKPAPFDYVRPSTLAEACELLAGDEDARLIAGGQTLVPMLAMRLARPAKLIDIMRLPELGGIRQEDGADGAVVVGATTRQAQAERDPVIRASVPMLARALPWVGHPPTRNRGTVGGSVANADPSAGKRGISAFFVEATSPGLALSSIAAEAQQSERTYRIGWLAYGWTEGAERTSPEFVHELKKHQQSFVFEFRGHQDEKRLPGLARELVQAGVDVIVANGTVAAQAARSVTQSVPIVFLISGDPVGSGLVTSLARPGGNVTGPSAMSSDFATKRLELFKQAIPNLNRIGVLSTYDTASGAASWNGIEAAAPQARLQLRRITARAAADFEGVFAMVSKEKIDGLLISTILGWLPPGTASPSWRSGLGCPPCSKSGDSLRPEAC